MTPFPIVMAVYLIIRWRDLDKTPETCTNRTDDHAEN